MPRRLEQAVENVGALAEAVNQASANYKSLQIFLLGLVHLSRDTSFSGTVGRSSARGGTDTLQLYATI